MYKSILCPVDGSELAECSMEHVKAIASGCKVPEVVLLQVIEPDTNQTAEVPDNIIQESRQKRQEFARTYLASLADGLKKDGISARVATANGRADEAILEFAAKNSIDLIIMSTHGRSGVSRWTFGSVADNVMRNSPAPVLISSPAGCREGALV